MAASIDEETDEQLLARYVSSRDGTAFDALVRRHAPLVWGVCRRMLRQTPDAEDAFQATFIVLFRKAVSIRRSRSLAGWLHQVSHRVALRARATAARSTPPVDPHDLDARPEPASPAEEDNQREALHEEI